MSKLDQAIAAIKAGDKATGKQLLAEVLKEDRRNEDAWLWLTQTDITHEEKIKSFQNVLKLNPNNEAAKRGLAQLQAGSVPSEPAKGLLTKPPGPVTIPTPEPISPPTDKTTKQCPYCAETIKAEAAVCRFCGRDLAPATGMIASNTNAQLIDEYIAHKSTQGWQVVSRTESSVQLRRPKQWSRSGLILGAILLIVGLGLLILILTVIDYALQTEKVVYVTTEDLRLGLDPAKVGSGSNGLAIAVIIIICVLCGICALSSNTSSAPRPQPAIGQGWINGIEDCPDSGEYGQQVVNGANLYNDQDMLPMGTKIPHGQRVEILEYAGEDGLVEVRYGDKIGFVQDILIVGYDPITGDVRPKPEDCL